MKIIFICDEYPPGKNGGIGSAVRVLGRELVKQGHKVFVVGLYPYSYGEKDFEVDEGVKVWRLRYGINLGQQNNMMYKVFNKVPEVIKQYANGKKAFSSLITFINKLVIKEDIDLIEIPDYNTFAMNIGFVVKWPEFKVPLVLKSHGSLTKICNDLNQPVNHRLARIDMLLFNRADALSAVSIDTAAKNEKIFKTGKKTEILYNGIELPILTGSAAKRDKAVIYTGALTAQKGTYQLIKAWNQVVLRHPDATLTLFGKGNKKPLERIMSLQASGTVNFKGHVPREDLFNELSRATMAIFPSYTESFSLAPIEAMAVGCPVIYTIRSSGKELITSNENGLLIDPDDIAAIAQTIVNLIENTAAQANYSIKGKQTVIDRFTITKSAQEHCAFYERVIKNYKKNE